TDSGCTLLSEKPVIKLPFDEAGYQTTGTWEDSSVRAWLNDKFYNTFTEEEKALIALTHNTNPDNTEYGTPGGNDTDDHIFLLSLDEANTLDKKVRHCGKWYDMAHQWWWLRSPGANKDYTAYVGAGNNSEAKIDPGGDVSGNDYGAVRPALNLSFSGNAPESMNRTSSEEVAELDAIAGAKVGDVVAFGRYTWNVTDNTDGICTLLCETVVADMPYNDSKTDITWENCSLRRWLNEDFYNEKFTEGEKSMIVMTHNTFTKGDSSYDMDWGNDTDDRIYLLSINEANAVSDDIRDCGIDWWLRSPGKRQNEVVFVGNRSANLMGTSVNVSFGVRPAIRVRYSNHTEEQ
ncbi:MAG: hypothetical protein II664_07375, partial [Oscillospiraceae bacterium]|nr:hypothetical protein [Oscillospiraceae bacterium]